LIRGIDLFSFHVAAKNRLVPAKYNGNEE